MHKLEYFATPKENLKIRMLQTDDELLARIQNEASNKNLLPDASEYYTDIIFPDAPDDHPYSFCSVVLSSDGKMAFTNNPRGPVIAKNNFLDPDGALCDFWVLNILRAHADAVVIGANTLHAEPGVTSHVYDEDLAKQRIENLGKKEHPLAAIVSFDATDIPFDSVYFHTDPAERYKVTIGTSPEGKSYIDEHSPLKHIVYGPFQTKADVDAFEFPELYTDFETFPVIVTGERNRPDTALYMYVLRKMGMEHICIESPSYCMSLLHLGLLNEYFINYSMVFAGGTVTPGYNMPFTDTDHPHAQLLSLGMHTHSFLYSRQKIFYDVTQEEDLSKYNY